MAYIPCLVMQEALLSSRPKPSLLKNIRLDLSQFIPAGLFSQLSFGFSSSISISKLAGIYK